MGVELEIRHRRLGVQTNITHLPLILHLPLGLTYPVCLVPELIVKIDNRIYELLSTDRLTRLKHYVYNTSERLKREKYREEILPSA